MQTLSTRARPLAVTDRATGANILLARFATLDLAFARGEAGEARSAYDDLVGPNIGAVMARVGWRYDGAMARVDAFLPDSIDTHPSLRMMASSWAGVIQAQDGSLGINISYGVGAAHRGAGLGRLLAYCAVAECLAHEALTGEAIPTFVNIQVRATNEASLAVARSLGVPAFKSAGFMVPGTWDWYLGFREPIHDFLARGLAYTRDRLPGYDPGALAAFRLGLLPKAATDLDLLGWLEASVPGLEAEAGSVERPRC